MQFHLDGLIGAVFTPMERTRLLKLDPIPAIDDHLESDRVERIYFRGSTGEGGSLTVRSVRTRPPYMRTPSGSPDFWGRRLRSEPLTGFGHTGGRTGPFP